jgi:hypothetical protein
MYELYFIESNRFKVVSELILSFNEIIYIFISTYFFNLFFFLPII